MNVDDEEKALGVGGMGAKPPSEGRDGGKNSLDSPRSDRSGARAPRANVAAVESSYQLLLWLIPVLDGLPRSQKFQLGDRLQSTALQVLDTLIEAAYNRERSALLRRANLDLEKLRFWVRLAKDLKLLDFKRYEHASRLIDDLGRQVGGWLRADSGLRKAADTPAVA